MCGRFAMNEAVNSQIEEFVRRGGDFREWTVAEWIEWEPAYNIAPTDNAPFLYVGGAEPGLRFGPAYWSLVPPRAEDMKVKFTFNARSDRLMENGLWRAAVTKRRGLIFANGYYEWQQIPGESRKRPQFIHHPGQDVIGFAALYGWWQEPAHRRSSRDAPKDPHGWHLTATMITSDAVQTLEHIHDRNPVVLPRQMWAHWVDPTVVGDQHLVNDAVAAGVAEASQFVFHQVAPIRNSVVDGPELIQPVDAT